MSITILHTSDWHLGKKLFTVDRYPEQEFFLNWLTTIIKKMDIDLLAIAGDIFDTAIPPSSALKQYFDFLERVTNETQASVIIISGNHDSGKFLEAPSGILSEKKIRIFGQLNEDPKTHIVRVKDKNEPTHFIDIFALPYFRNHELLNLIQKYKIANDEECSKNAITRYIQDGLKDLTGSGPRVLMAHHLFGNFEYGNGPEQSISISGLNSIPLSIFEETFDCLALGHIHRAQRLKNEKPMAIYSGSIIPMRFSEETDKKISICTFEKNSRRIKQEWVSIPQLKKIESLQTTCKLYKHDIEEMITKFAGSGCEILAEISMTMKDPIPGLSDEIRETLLGTNISLLSLKTMFGPEEDVIRSKHRTTETLPTTVELFKEFYLSTHPDSKEVPPYIHNAFIALLDEIRADERGQDANP